MKFLNILLTEGRKENLIKKYEKDFGFSLQVVLNDEFSKETNYKYVDWLFSKATKGSQPTIDKGLRLLKEFDKINSNLKRKDINQYLSIDDLEFAIEEYHEEKGEKPEIEKIYEDDTFVVVIPENQAASCKYGANTKWCVTMRNTSYFTNYTSGFQKLYFIINKKNSTDEFFSKVAVHYDNDGNVTYYNSKDETLSQREIQLFSYSFPQIVKAIENNYDESIGDKEKLKIAKVFDLQGVIVGGRNNIFNTKKDLKFLIRGFDLDTDMGFGHATGQVSFILEDKEGSEVIDEYDILMMFDYLGDDTIGCSASFMSRPDFTATIDLGLEGRVEFTYEIKYRFNYHYTADLVKTKLLEKISTFIYNNKQLQKELVGDDIIAWRPNIHHGYTFKRKDKGLVNKLVKYLDEGNIGTKLDFLVYAGKLVKREKDGKTVYDFPKSKGNQGPILRAYYSSFFSSAKLAGILSYEKKGRTFLLKKGPNFEEFKSGKLRAL